MQPIGNDKCYVRIDRLVFLRFVAMRCINLNEFTYNVKSLEICKLILCCAYGDETRKSLNASKVSLFERFC